jgi:hypothetical protein
MGDRTEPEKKAPATSTGKEYRSVWGTDTAKKAWAFLPTEVKAGLQTSAATNAFTEAFVKTTLASLTEADAEKLKSEFSTVTAHLEFRVGFQGGMIAGIAIDVADNVVGLLHIAKLALEYSPIGMTANAIANVAEYAWDPDLYVRLKKQEGQYALDVAKAVKAFADRIASDPMFLLNQGEELGAACGEMASTWFHKDFMAQSKLHKGYTVGKGLGIAATEIALLFLGPEEWVAKGLMTAGRIAKGSRLYRAIIKILREMPEIARLLKVKTEVEDGLRVVNKAEKGAADAKKAEKALAAAGEAPKPKPSAQPHGSPTLETKPAAPPAKATPAKKGAPRAPAEPHAPASPAKAAAKPNKPAKAPPVKAPPAKAPPAKTAAPRKRLKDLPKKDRAAVNEMRKQAQIEADAIRKSGVRNADGLPPGWDYAKHPHGPKRNWLPGDPVNMPDGAGNYPSWDTIRGRVWKTKALDELAARKAGTAKSADRLLHLDPIGELTAEELRQVAKTGTMPERVGAEIEHKRIPQRIGRMLEEAGLPANEARDLSKLGDASNLDPTHKQWHAAVDQKAKEINPNRNPTLPSSLDDRAEFPLGGATNQEIAAMVDKLRQRGIDLDATPAGRELRRLLQVEKERRGAGASWVLDPPKAPTAAPSSGGSGATATAEPIKVRVDAEPATSTADLANQTSEGAVKVRVDTEPQTGAGELAHAATGELDLLDDAADKEPELARLALP